MLGAGIIGLTIGEELTRRGHDVEVVDPDPGNGASFAAAGMLSPAAEMWFGETDLLRMGSGSLRRWPELAARLGVRLRRGGTLLVGHDHGDRQLVERQCEVLAASGLEVAPLESGTLARLEPCLGRVQGAVHLVHEASIDPRAVIAALRGRIPVLPAPSGRAVSVTVLATGARLPAPYDHLVRGVRGEVLRLRSDNPPTRTVRGWVAGQPVYLVPRAEVEVVVGATSEETGAAPVVTAGGVRTLLTAARALWPALDRAELLEATARDRPTTADGLPLVGPVAPGVVLAAGHYRHGVLLAPLTAHLVAEHLETGHVDPALDPHRFQGKDGHA